MTKWTERVRASLFLKIILLFLAAHITIGAVGYAVHRYFGVPHHQQSINKNMEHYSRYLASEIGVPADTLKARALCDTYQIRLRIADDSGQWVSDATVPDFSQLAPSSDAASAISSGVYKDYFYVLLNQNNGRFLFLFDVDTHREVSALEWRLVIMVLVMMLILTIIYFSIRFMLRPIKTMNKAVAAISSGDLGHQIEVKRRDELGDLMNSFNAMADRLKEMISSRDQLLLDVSHELRSPLTRIKVALEFLDDSAGKEAVKTDINEMEQMVAELLESERLNSAYGGLHIQSTNLTALVQNIVATKKTAQPGIQFLAPQEDIWLEADPERLHTAFGNIIENALKYSQSATQPVEVSLDILDSRIQIRIKDFGPGIPESELDSIFEPFYRVDKSRSKETGGYGLGLSIVKKIIQQHYGQIEIKSTLNRGTTFIITLPVKQK